MAHGADTRSSRRPLLTVAIPAVLALLLWAAPASAQAPATRYVSNTDPTCGGQSPCYTTIQAAVTAAQPGDTVRVLAGTYVEQIDVLGKNDFPGASEAHRLTIEADPALAPGAVVLDGAVGQCTLGYAVRFQQSRFVTLRGFTITGAGGAAIHLMGGNNQNEAIHLERNRIFGNGSPECSGGITVNRGNPGTLIANNLIYGNGRHGLVFLDEVGGPHYVVGNTIHANAWTGVWVARDHQTLLANNAVTGNGTAAGSTGGRFGITREASTVPDPPGLQLLHNLVCGNRLGEITGPALDATDAGNLTPTGAEGPGVAASPGCEAPAAVYANVAGPDGLPNTADDDFTLAAASPALDAGIDPRTLGLDPGLHPLFEASFAAPASRPGGAGFDIGAMEVGGGTVPDTEAPAIVFVRPEPSAFVRQSVPVEAQATDAGSGVAAFVLAVDGQALGATLTPTPPAAAVTATATWDTTAWLDGAHTLAATATDGAGNTASATRVVIVDNTPPDTAVTGGPTGVTPDPAAIFTFTGSDALTATADLVFAWRLDGAAYTEFSADTTATASGLPDGTHTFEVKARDRAGNEDPTPAARPFMVDTTAPETAITGGPSGTIAVSTATVTFTGSDALTATADLVFAWRLDGGAYTAFSPATTATLEGLSEGPHTVEVKARDQAGHEDPTPASASFTVSLPPPAITGLVPDQGPVGTLVTLHGTHFGDAPGDNQVRFAGGVTATVETATPTALTVLVPAGAATGPVTVTRGGQAGTSPAPFTVQTPLPGGIALAATPVAWPQAIGIDHHEPTNSLVLSVNYLANGEPHVFELVGADGSRAPFTASHGFFDEVKLATVRSGPCQGGFLPGQLFAGNGLPGRIVRVSPDGGTVDNPWVVLPGETGTFRGGLVQDRHCAVGGDLVAVTTAGNVWRITAAGVPTLLASLPNTHLEGVTTVPDDPARYGPWAGKILAGAETLVRVVAVDPQGGVTLHDVGLRPEDLDVIPANEHFYGVDYGGRTVQAAPAAAFAGLAGDLLITEEEPGRLWHVRWDPAANAFQKRLLAEVSKWEHVTFSPAAIPPLLPLPQALFLVIDGDSLGSGVAPNFFSDPDLGVASAAVGQRAPLPYFASHAGDPLTLYTGTVGDEGWFALTAVPASWAAAGPTADGLRNFVGGSVGEPELAAVPGLTPLRAAGLWRLAGSRVCALVYPSDVGVSYGPLAGDLRGPTLGLVAFEVLAVTERAGALGGNLPEVTLQILDTGETCGARLSLDATAPAPVSPAEPFDVEPPGVAPIRGLFVTPLATTVPLGLTAPFRAMAIRADGVREDVTAAAAWASAVPAVATVDAGGAATAAGLGTTAVSATAGGRTGAALLTVAPPVVVSLAVAPAAAEIEVGGSQAFAAIGTFSDGSTQTLTTGITWSSTTASVATVTAAGLATGVGAGTAGIVATRTSVPPATATLVVRPRPPTIYGPLTAGAAAATGTATGGASVQVFVNAAARGAAAVASTEGLWTATGLAPALVGGDVVTARQTVNGVTSVPSAPVTVIDGPVRTIAISVTPFTAAVARGLTRQFAATGVSSDGLVRDVTATAAWSSSTLFVAYVNPTGLATGLNPGAATVAARFEGVTGTASFTVTLPTVASLAVSPTAPLLFVNQTQPMTVTGTLTDGTSRDLAGQGLWTSSDPAVATVTAVQGLVTARAAGTATITVTQGTLSASAVVTVSALVADGDFPVAEITAPAANARVTAPTAVVGTATDPNFYYYVLEVAPAGETSFTPIATGLTPVVDGALGTFDPTLLINDLYTVRLRVVDRGGKVTTAEAVYQVDRHLKVGLFTLAFQDLRVRVAGLPISIVRVYDSRDKRQGDFGVGWRLDLQTLRLRANRVPGTRWQVDRIPGFPVDTYVLAATDAHTVSLTLPDGKVEAFELTPSPGSQAGVPFLTVDAAYSPTPGTLGALRALEGTALVVDGAQPGPVTLLDVDAQPYYPRRWEYTAADGRVFVLDRLSGVESAREPNGNTLTISATGITHSAGPGVQFLRDGVGRILQITDPKGNAHRYAYDGAGDLTDYASPGGVTRHLYDGRHGLLEVRDPRGIRALKNEYDAGGRLVATEGPDGHRITYTHDLAARQELIRDRLGHPTLYEYDDEGNILATTDPLGARTTYTYDARGNKLSETDPLGNVTISTYDARDNRLSETKTVVGQAVVTQWTYNAFRQVLTTTDPLGRVTTNTYDPAGNLLSTTDATGGVTQHTYDAGGNRLSTTDPLGNVTTFTYDAAGRVLTKTDAAGTTTFTYDGNGNTATERNPRGAMTSFGYDGLNRRLSTQDPLAAVTRSEYDPAGNRTAEVSPLGFRTTHVYDAANRLIQTTFPDGTSSQAAYDAEGNRISTTNESGRVTAFAYDAAKRRTQVTFPDGAAQQFGYDLAGRQTSETDPRGQTWQTTYDSVGRPITRTDPLGATTTIGYDLAGNRIAETDATGRTTQFAYDAKDRLTVTTLPGGQTTQAAYDLAGRKTSETDAAGRTTQFAYDGVGRLTSVTDAAGGITRSEYDGAGNRTAIVDARGNRTTLAYDLANRQMNKTWPGGGTESQTYDLAGRLLTKANPLGQTIRYAYDMRDRLLTKTYPDTSTVQFTYTPTGQRATAVDARGTTTYVYDARNRLTQLTSPDGQAIGYTYDPASRLASISSLAGTIAYIYDSGGRLREIVDPTGGISTATYDAAGRRVELAYPNGTTVSSAYDPNGRLLALTHRDTIGQILAAYTYTLSPAGQRTRIEESTGRIKTYAYDALARLIQEQVTDLAGAPVYETGFTYDAVGNRLTKTTALGADPPTTTTYSYNAADQLLSEDGVSYTYDLAGRLTSKTDGTGTTTYQYDFENRLVRVTTPAGSTTFAYDADGNRVERTDATGTVRYLADPNRPLAQVLAEYTASGTLVASYVYADDLMTLSRGSQIAFYHADGLGSIRLLSDLNGTVTDTYDYDAFGTLVERTGTTDNTVLFTGQQFDSGPRIYYLRARYYPPWVARFVSRDPAEGDVLDPTSLHSYIYARSDPANLTDPSGRIPSLTAATVTMSVIGAITGFAAYTALHRPGAGTPEEDFSWTGAAVWAASGAAMGATVGYLGGYALAYWGPPVWITLNGATYVLGQELVNRWPNANVLLGHFLKHGQQVASILRTTNYTIDRYGADAVYILENPLYRKPIENGWAYIRYLGTSPSGTAYFGLVIEKLGRIVTFYPISVRDAAHGLFREFVLR